MLYSKTLNIIIKNMFVKIFKQFCKQKSVPQAVKTPKILNKAEEIELTQQKMQQQVELRLKQLENRHRETQELIDKKLKFPIKLCGTSDKYESRYAYLPERILSYYKIPKYRINDYLLKMFKASLYAIADRNTSYMDEYWEKGLKQKSLQAIDDAKNQNLLIKVYQDPNYLQEISESCEIIDSIMMRGVSMNRQENKNPKQYLRHSEADEVGLITFTPKHVTENNQNFIDPAKNKSVYSGYDNMLLRVLVRIKSPLKLSIPEFNVPNQLYTWEHLCIMQNQMVSPKPLESNYKLQTFMEWLGKYRFGPWKVADIDNFMKGNSVFRKYRDDQEQIDPIFKGTKFDKSSYIDIRMV